MSSTERARYGVMIFWCLLIAPGQGVGQVSGATGGQWLQPIQILGGRMVKFSGQIEF